MKRTVKPITIVLLAATMAIGGGISSRAMATARDIKPVQGVEGEEEATGPGRHQLQRLVKTLDLTAAQKEEIKTIFEAERQTAKPLMLQMRENRHQLHEAAVATPFDEAAIRTLAAKQAATMTDLIVSRARITGKIFALLTPEQQAKAKKHADMLEGQMERPQHRKH